MMPSRTMVVLTSALVLFAASCAAEPEPAADKWAVCAADEPTHVTLTDVGELREMHVACQGNKGPGIVMLHGFPEYWRAYKGVMGLLAATHQTVVPDQRGYNLTAKPDGISSYHIDKLAADIKALLERLTDPVTGTLKRGEVTLVGHDWGGAVAWVVAHRYPELVGRLVIVNGPHPDAFHREYTENPAQKSASGYMSLFSTVGIEPTLMANDFGLLMGALGSSLSKEDKAAYLAMFKAGGESGLTSMLNWYRANINTDTGQMTVKDVTVKVPTLVVWGMDDTALLPGCMAGLETWVSDLKRQRIPGATHWVMHERPKTVARAIADFTAGLPIPATAAAE
ncbi:MAG: alpha/beta hydrolase [Myxococcales bacterium]|nr:alpha/beta hydrolase [Myxococcales bacterium]